MCLEMKQKSLKINIILNMLRTLMGFLFPLITFPYSSRILGPIYIGKVNFAHSIISYFSLIAGLGISTYSIREAAKIRDNKEKLSIFIKEVFIINLISTFVAYILFAIALFAVPLFTEYRKLLCICSISILFTTLGIEYLYSAIEDYTYITIRSIIFQFISLFLLFIFVHKTDDYLKYAGIAIFSSVGANLLNFFHARRYLDFNVKAKLNLKKHLKPIFVFFAMNIAVSIYTILDSTMLGFIKGDESVGIYTAATKINRMVIAMITSATSVLLPRLSYYTKQENNKDFFKLVNQSFKFLILVSIPCAIGLFVLTKQIILLFSGEKYYSAIEVMKIMNPVIVFISISNFTGIQILMSVGKEKITFYSIIAGSVMNLIMNSIFIPSLGTKGAALGTLCAEFTVMLIQLIFTFKYINYKEALSHIIKTLLSAIIMGIVVYFSTFIFNNIILQTFIGIVIGIFSYIICLFLFRDKFFIDFTKNIFTKIIAKFRSKNNV